jgi:hypothetical protein
MSKSKKTNGTVKVIKRDERARLHEIKKAANPKKKEPADAVRDINSTVEGWVREFKRRRDSMSVGPASILGGKFPEGEIAA